MRSLRRVSMHVLLPHSLRPLTLSSARRFPSSTLAHLRALLFRCTSIMFHKTCTHYTQHAHYFEYVYVFYALCRGHVVTHILILGDKRKWLWSDKDDEMKWLKIMIGKSLCCDSSIMSTIYSTWPKMIALKFISNPLRLYAHFPPPKGASYQWYTCGSDPLPPFSAAFYTNS